MRNVRSLLSTPGHRPGMLERALAWFQQYMPGE